MPPSSGSLGSANKANSKASLSSLQQQQQQIMAQMQITQQALMLGQNMDNQTGDPQSDGLKGREGLLLNEKGAYPHNSSFGLSNNKKSQRQVPKK